MGESGGQRAQSLQTLSAADDLVGVAVAEEHSLQQMQGHREPFLHHAREGRGLQNEEPGRFGDPEGPGVVRIGPVTHVRGPGAGIGAAVVGAHQFQVLAARQLGLHRLTGDENVEAGGGLTLAVHRSRLELFDPPFPAQPGKLFLVELLEQEQGAQLFGVAAHAGRFVGHCPPPTVSPGIDGPA